jgi:hypothetical protein
LPLRLRRSLAFTLVAALAALVLVLGSSTLPGVPTIEAATPPCQGSYCATFTVSLSGSGAGTYRTSDGAINCHWAGGVQSGTCTHQFVWSYALGPTIQVVSEETPSAKSDGCVASTGLCDQNQQGTSFVLTAGQSLHDSVEFRHLPQTVWITVTGTGTVTIEPGGITCRSTCSNSLPYGSRLTLTATPDAGSSFSAWTGSCAGQGPTCSIDLGVDVTTTAEFVPASPFPLPGPSATIPSVRLVAPGPVGASSVPARVDWSGIATTAPIVAFEVQRRTGAGTWSSVGLVSPLSTSAAVSLPIGVATEFRVRARDSAGVTGDWTTGPSRTALAYQESSSLVTYTSGWATTTAAADWAGHVRAARIARRSATFTFTGLAIALVAPRGPTEGSARIAVDGVVVKTVSLYARSTLARQVVFVRAFGSSGRHRLTITVVGTAGHPEVDIDGFAVLR